MLFRGVLLGHFLRFVDTQLVSCEDTDKSKISPMGFLRVICMGLNFAGDLKDPLPRP